MSKFITVLAVLAALAAAPAFGQHEEAHHGHKHHVALFLGNTHDDHGEDAFTVGLVYEYRLTELFGLGAMVDRAGGDIESTLAGGVVYLHPLKNTRLAVVAANEHRDGEDEFVVRVGLDYDIHVFGWDLSPVIEVDLLEHGENWIYGVGLGRGF
jgi:hypothetical protein